MVRIFKNFIIFLLLICVLSFFLGCNKIENKTDESLTDIFQTETDEINPKTILSKYKDYGNGGFPDAEPLPGEVFMSTSIDWALQDPDTDNCLFDLRIILTSIEKTAFVYDGTTIYELENSEISHALADDRSVWRKKFRDSYPNFYEWVAEIKGHEISKQYEKFPEKIDVMYAALDEWYNTDNAKKAFKKVYQNEYNKLKTQGFDVEIINTNDNLMLRAILTKEQIKTFPYDEQYGYYVLWNNSNE